MYSFYDYLPKAQNGKTVLPPSQEDYPDYNSYRAALDYYIANVGVNDINLDYPELQSMYSGADSTAQVSGVPSQLATQMAAAQSQIANAAYSPNSYTGDSIVDYLGAQPGSLSTNYATRAALAQQMGIPNYRGTADQNMQMLKTLRSNPNMLSNYPTTGGSGTISGSRRSSGSNGSSQSSGVPSANQAPTSSSASYMPQPGFNPYTMPPIAGNMLPPGFNAKDTMRVEDLPEVKDKLKEAANSNKNYGTMIGTVGTAVAVGYIGYKKGAQLINDIKAGKFTSSEKLQMEIDKAASNLLKSTGENAVASVKADAEWFKSLPKKQQAILNKLDAAEIPGQLTQGTLEFDEAANAAKALPKFPKLGAGFNKAVNAAKDLKIAETIKEAGVAAKETPVIAKTLQGISKLAKFIKGTPKLQYGGSDEANFNYYDNPFLESQYGGEEYADGGAYRESNFSGNAWYRDGGTNNPGFRALPEFVQHQILSNMAYGGIHINPANEGKFTTSAQRAGMGVQEFASHVLANREDYSPMQVKRANFAHNAASWKHANGGQARIGQELEVTPEQAEMLRQQGYQFEII
jgi:hypothetical protein